MIDREHLCVVVLSVVVVQSVRWMVPIMQKEKIRWLDFSWFSAADDVRLQTLKIQDPNNSGLRLGVLEIRHYGTGTYRYYDAPSLAIDISHLVELLR